MPGLNKIRKRPITLVFRVSSNEAKQINERIAISGLPRGKYFCLLYTSPSPRDS